MTSKNLMPPGYDKIEFSQFNHDYNGLPYKYGYVLRYPYLAGCQIVKMNMDDPTGNVLLYTNVITPNFCL